MVVTSKKQGILETYTDISIYWIFRYMKVIKFIFTYYIIGTKTRLRRLQHNFKGRQFFSNNATVNSMNHQNLLGDEEKLGFADTENDFELVNDFVVDENYKNCTHASHCMIYSKSNVPILDIYQPRSLILMQFRFDGYLGFPGGIVDPGESPEEALNRELSEELGLVSLVELKQDDRLMIHYNRYKSLVLHFFVKEVTSDVFREIELRSIKAPEYGNEVLGTLRVPLYTMTDGYRGFPAFLQNKFIGNSRQQLLESLIKLNLMSPEEIQKAITALPSFFKNSINSEKS